MAIRRSLSKSTRFTVFARDNFTCRYCGRQSDQVKLVIDHITPVCQGGENDPENLITSCEDCNSGKSGKTIAQAAPNDTDRLRLLQEHQEQIAAHQAVLDAARHRRALHQEVCNFYCELFGRQKIDQRTLNVLVAYVQEFGPEQVFRWLESAMGRLPGDASDMRIGKYVSGIRRNFLDRHAK